MKQTMLRLITVALMSTAAWGCAVPVPQEQETLPAHLMQIAMQDREAAYEQLAKAMTVYCKAKHATLEARHTCLLERRLEWLHLRQVYTKRPGTP
jgi:predicted lipoprotein